MKFLKNLFDFYINSSIHVSLAVVALVYVTTAEFDFSFSKNLVFFIFFGSITGYNFVKYAGVAKLYHRSLAKSMKLIQISSFLCFAALVYFSFQLPIRTLFATVLFGLMTLLYALPIFPKQKNLRSFGGIKIFVIGFVWAGVTVVLPTIHVGAAINAYVLVEFLQRTLFVIAITLPFEIRDLKYDHKHLKTIPQTAGISKTKKLGVLLLMFSFSAEFLQNWKTIPLMVFLVIAILSAFLIMKGSINQSKYYASFGMEAVPIVWAVLLLIFY